MPRVYIIFNENLLGEERTQEGSKQLGAFDSWDIDDRQAQNPKKPQIRLPQEGGAHSEKGGMRRERTIGRESMRLLHEKNQQEFFRTFTCTGADSEIETGSP